MKKIIAAVVGGTAVASLAFASASMLDVDGGVVQTGATTNGLACDDDGVKIDWALETDDNKVHFATIKGVDEECAGAALVLRTNLGSKDVTTIPTGGGDVRIDFGTPLNAEALSSARVWIGR